MKTKYTIITLIVIVSITIAVLSIRKFSQMVDSSYIEIPTMPQRKYTQDEIKSLTLLCKIWGFMKYYHPKVREGNYDWDQELFQIMPSLVSISSKEKRNEILTEWIEQFHFEMKTQDSITLPSKSVKMYPDLNWIGDTVTLGIKLSEKLKCIYKAQRDMKSHYVTTKGSPNATFKNEEIYAQCGFPNINYQLLSLFRFWNAIQYYYPYRYLLKEDWSNTLSVYLPLFLDIKDRTDYENTIKRLLTEIHDSHAMISRSIQQKSLLPVFVRFIEGKAVVIRSYENNLNKQEQILQPGDVLLNINGESIDSFIQRTTPYISASNHATLLRDIAITELIYANNAFFYVDFERNGSIEKRKIAGVSGAFTEPNVFQSPEPFMKTFPTDILYL